MYVAKGMSPCFLYSEYPSSFPSCWSLWQNAGGWWFQPKSQFILLWPYSTWLVCTFVIIFLVQYLLLPSFLRITSSWKVIFFIIIFIALILAQWLTQSTILNKMNKMLIKVKGDECIGERQQRELDIIEGFICLDMDVQCPILSPRICRLVFILVSFSFVCLCAYRDHLSHVALSNSLFLFSQN